MSAALTLATLTEERALREAVRRDKLALAAYRRRDLQLRIFGTAVHRIARRAAFAVHDSLQVELDALRAIAMDALREVEAAR